MGAQGPVFRAQDTVAGQIVAIKAFKLDVSPELAPSIAEALRDLVGQAPFVEGLVPLIDAGLEGDTPWLAMEHLACPTLDMRLREGGLLPLDEATALVRALADAVDAAHAHGLDHGSLHPRDVFLPEAGGVVVSGFGVAAAVGVAGLRPPRRRPFTAPETLSQKPLDAPADRYALGVIAYEIVSGRRLLGAGDDLARRPGCPRCHVGHPARGYGAGGDAGRAARAPAVHRHRLRPGVLRRARVARRGSRDGAGGRRGAAAADVGRRARPRSRRRREALAEFARQGTFWEPPRRGVDGRTPRRSSPAAVAARLEDAPTAPGGAPAGLPRAARRGRSGARAGAGPDSTLDAETVTHDAPLRVEPRAATPASRRCSGPSATPPNRTPPPAPAPVQEQHRTRRRWSSLALTLGLGLAVGAAGGYLSAIAAASAPRSGPSVARRARRPPTSDTALGTPDRAGRRRAPAGRRRESPRRPRRRRPPAAEPPAAPAASGQAAPPAADPGDAARASGRRAPPRPVSSSSGRRRRRPACSSTARGAAARRSPCAG